MPQKTTRIGLIGYGQIGATVHQMIDNDPNNGMEVVFVHDQLQERLQGLSADLTLGDLGDFASKEPDLVVEMAHPDVTREWGQKLLQKTNYLLISVTALADQEIEKMLEATTREFGTRAFLPHGGVVGMDALLENRDVWDEVHSVMKKPPKNVDCAAAGVDPDSITEETTLYDGPTRGVCPQFPRNTNTLAAIAYAGIGFDRTRSTLIVNPAWDTATVEIHAKGGGITMDVSRVEGITGVTGASTPASIFNTIQMIGSTGPGIHIR
jgi:aspartate dehydrogenase